jgi:hypothetical protein
MALGAAKAGDYVINLPSINSRTRQQAAQHLHIDVELELSLMTSSTGRIFSVDFEILFCWSTTGFSHV